MFSLNVPVPGAVSRVAADLEPELVGSGMEVRERHGLLVKRFEGVDSLHRLRSRLREVLVGEPAFEARITGVDAFERPVRGDGPVVYLAVESPGLLALHGRLVDAFGAVEGLEGEGYVPHVTLGRGGRVDTLERLRSTDVEPVTWTVSELAIWDARYGEIVARIGLPAR